MSQASTQRVGERTGSVRRGLRRAMPESLAIACLTYGFFSAGAWIKLHHLPAGQQFLFQSRGLVAVGETVLWILIATVIAFLPIIPAFAVRRKLGLVVRLLLFPITIVPLVVLESRQPIAVVQGRDSFTFARRYPFGETVFPIDRLPAFTVIQSPAGRMLRLNPRFIRLHSVQDRVALRQGDWPGA